MRGIVRDAEAVLDDAARRMCASSVPEVELVRRPVQPVDHTRAEGRQRRRRIGQRRRAPATLDLAHAPGFIIDSTRWQAAHKVDTIPSIQPFTNDNEYSLVLQSSSCFSLLLLDPAFVALSCLSLLSS